MADAATSPVGATGRVGVARLAIGLAQGLAAAGLYRAAHNHAWPATDHPLFAALELVTAFVPLVVMAGLGHLRRLTLALWTILATALTAATASYSIASQLPALRIAPSGPHVAATQAPIAVFPGFEVVAFTAAALFNIHHLLVPADAERRLVARYPGYFDVAWLNGVQLGLAIAFTVAFWIVLALGAALFGLIGIKGFGQLIVHPWFYFPATGVAFAAAVHLGDVRVNLTRGLRTVGLTLLSWLLPVMMLIAVAFLFALPFTGLAPLWRAGSATGIVLAAMASLIILINAGYQDGEHPAGPVLRWSARITGVILAPLVCLAVYGLGLRIGQHGLSPSRIIAAACALVGVCYAAGYAFAAVRPGRWMGALEPTNVAAAVLIVAVIVALFSPIADPARISANDQVARLENGKQDPARFDFRFLRFQTGRFGVAALKRLAARKETAATPRLAARAAQALKWDESACRWADCSLQLAAPRKIAVYPAGASLPADFPLDLEVSEFGGCNDGFQCEAYLVDLEGDGKTEVLLLAPTTAIEVFADNGGRWSKVGQFVAGCGMDLNILRSGAARPVPSPWPDLVVGGARLPFHSESSCEPAPPVTGGAARRRPGLE